MTSLIPGASLIPALLAPTVLSAAERERIEAAVRRAEARTAGEFVAVVTRASGEYPGLSLVVPAVAALLLPLPLLGLSLVDSAWRLWEWQLGVFLALALLTRLTTVVHWLVPRRVQRANAALAARTQFLNLGLAGTRERTGVLLFVSVAEHYVEIVADTGIAGRVDPAAWQAIVDAFVADVRRGRVASAFERAIDACGDVMAAVLPRRADDTNELADAIVEL